MAEDEVDVVQLHPLERRFGPLDDVLPAQASLVRTGLGAPKDLGAEHLAADRRVSRKREKHIQGLAAASIIQEDKKLVSYEILTSPDASLNSQPDHLAHDQL